MEYLHSNRERFREAVDLAVYPGVDSSIKSSVLIETSYTTLSFPIIDLPVKSYIGEMLKEEAPDMLSAYGLDKFEMKVQDINRTFVDKVYAICDYYLQNKVNNHSRHIYDIYKLMPFIKKDDEIRNLIEKVREERKAAIVCLSAKDGVCINVLLKEIIEKDVYKEDYENLTEKLLAETVPYEKAIEAVKEIYKEEYFRKV